MKIKATTPCYKFINALPNEQMDKILEEILEVGEAWRLYVADKSDTNLLPLLMELLDVKAAINTAIEQIKHDVIKNNSSFILGVTKSGDPANYIDFISSYKNAKQSVIKKNVERGYYIMPTEE